MCGACVRACVGQMSEDDLAALITKCSNSLWSLRESSLLELAAQVELRGPPARTLLAQAPRIVEAASERVAVCVCVCARVRARVRERECVCILHTHTQTRARACMCVCVCVCVQDAHYKVQQAALALLSALASNLAACLSPHLETVLRQILPRLVDKKDASRKACVALLNRLYYACGPQVRQ